MNVTCQVKYITLDSVEVYLVLDPPSIKVHICKEGQNGKGYFRNFLSKVVIAGFLVLGSEWLFSNLNLLVLYHFSYPSMIFNGIFPCYSIWVLFFMVLSELLAHLLLLFIVIFIACCHLNQTFPFSTREKAKKQPALWDQK